jgi:hypothetical protein
MINIHSPLYYLRDAFRIVLYSSIHCSRKFIFYRSVSDTKLASWALLGKIDTRVCDMLEVMKMCAPPNRRRVEL